MKLLFTKFSARGLGILIFFPCSEAAVSFRNDQIVLAGFSVLTWWGGVGAKCQVHLETGAVVYLTQYLPHCTYPSVNTEHVRHCIRY